jgi:hypothetical protein
VSLFGAIPLPSKSRSGPKTPIEGYYYGGTPQRLIASWMNEYPTNVESISWINGEKCSHEKSWYKFLPMNYSNRIDLNKPDYAQTSLSPSSMQMMSVAGHTTFTPTWKDIEAKIVNPFGNNLAVSLFELGDIKETLASFKSRDLRDWHLGTVFGVLPIVSDVAKLYRSVKNMEDHFNSLFGRSGEWSSIRFKRKSSGNKITGSFYSDGHLIDVRTQWETVSRFSCKAKWSLPFGKVNFTRAWGNYLGLNVDPSDIWAVVPLSFIVDWVYNIDGWLESLDTSTITSSLDLKDCYCSSKVKGVTTLVVGGKNPDWQHQPSIGSGLAERKFERYLRYASVPRHFNDDLFGSGFSAGKAATAASLSSKILSSK